MTSDTQHATASAESLVRLTHLVQSLVEYMRKGRRDIPGDYQYFDQINEQLESIRRHESS